MALALQAALLLEAGHGALADAFCATRLAGRGMVYGELPAGLDCATIVERARPQPA
jgi:putative acyl-CoA dehydrogenase